MPAAATACGGAAYLRGGSDWMVPSTHTYDCGLGAVTPARGWPGVGRGAGHAAMRTCSHPGAPTFFSRIAAGATTPSPCVLLCSVKSLPRGSHPAPWFGTAPSATAWDYSGMCFPGASCLAAAQAWRSPDTAPPFPPRLLHSPQQHYGKATAVAAPKGVARLAQLGPRRLGAVCARDCIWARQREERPVGWRQIRVQGLTSPTDRLFRFLW